MALETATWINKLIQYVQSVNGACAIWRLPADDTIHILADCSGGSLVNDKDLDELSRGFVIAPFEKDKHAVIHLSPDLQGAIKMDLQDSDDKALPTQVEWEEENKALNDFKNFIFIQQSNSAKTSFSTDDQDIHTTTEDDYCNWVKQGIEQIKEEVFYKVVPSKIKVVDTDKEIDLGEAYLNAAAKYTTAFVSLTVSPEAGIWLGATPELLIEDVQDGYFKTVALAGTQLRTANAVAATAWTQKEIEEQAYVSRYIINCFKKIRLRDYEEIGPKTIEAGNLLHLKTAYKVDKQKANFPELASVMLKLLHPTSAVCGMPKEAALAFINQHEPHDRAYFSGFLGPVHQQGKTNIFVNLRCCQFKQGKIIFYAGAGITEDSDPEKEWLETEMKCRVLADVIITDQLNEHAPS